VSAVSVGVIATLLSFVAIFGDALRTFLQIHVTSWSLRLQGVEAKEIHKIALAKARRELQNVLVQILKIILDFVKSLKK
jgi:hypothetical protein